MPILASLLALHGSDLSRQGSLPTTEMDKSKHHVVVNKASLGEACIHMDIATDLHLLPTLTHHHRLHPGRHSEIHPHPFSCHLSI